MSAATETITAAELRPGDVVRRIPRDQCQHPLTAGRTKIEVAEPYSPGGETEYIWLCFAYASRQCTYDCAEQPYGCRHMDGSAGGGSGRVLRTQELERYVR